MGTDWPNSSPPAVTSRPRTRSPTPRTRSRSEFMHIRLLTVVSMGLLSAACQMPPQQARYNSTPVGGTQPDRSGSAARFPSHFARFDPARLAAEPPSKMTEMTAKAAIEADGYKGVRALSRGPDGVWKAWARRGETDVMVRVDSTGDVSATDQLPSSKPKAVHIPGPASGEPAAGVSSRTATP